MPLDFSGVLDYDYASNLLAPEDLTPNSDQNTFEVEIVNETLNHNVNGIFFFDWFIL